MNDVLGITLFILAGMLLGALCRKQTLLLRIAGKAASWILFPLLFMLGAGLGGHRELLAQLPALGGKAACIALCAVFGSALCMRGIGKHLGVATSLEKNRAASADPPSQTTAQTSPSPLLGTAGILLAFIVGVFCAYKGWLPSRIYRGPFTLYSVWALVFFVGVCLGGEPGAIRIMRALGPRILLVPFSIIAGTFLGSALAALLIPDLTVRDALTVGAGFGYYSLSSLIIDQLGNAPLAAVALLSNIFRELMGMLAAPFFVRILGPLAPVGVAAAPAMDTCLPAITRFSGERCAIIAVCSGIILTLLTPFCVTFLMTW